MTTELTELLSNNDLEYYCKKLKIKLNAVLSKDLYRNLKPKEGAYIINLQSSSDGNGTHWTALYIFKSICMYYDPFGIIMPNSIIKFCQKYNSKIKIIYNIDQIQHIKSIYCGWYCLYFLYFLHRNKNFTDKASLINNMNIIFHKNSKRKENDETLKRLFKKIFDLKK